MIDANSFAVSFQRNYHVIQMQTDGLTHADSMKQLPFRGNCLNWVLGHIIANRNSILEILGEKSIWEDRDSERYNRGSEPLTNEDDKIFSLEELLDDLEQSQDRMNKILENMTSEDLNREIDHRGEKLPISKRLFFLYFHETYHVGQTELLRQLSGKDDTIIS